MTKVDKKPSTPATVDEQIALRRTASPATPIRAVVDADLFLRAYSVVFPDDTRYFINGVHIEPAPSGGVLLVATGGHSLLCIRDPNGDYAGPAGGATIRALPHFLTMLRKPRRLSAQDRMWPRDFKLVVVDHMMALVELDAGTRIDDAGRDALYRAAVEQTGVVLAIQTTNVLVDGAYPDWNKCMPVLDHKVAPGAINEALLATLARALTPVGAQPHVRLTCGAPRTRRDRGSESDPILVRPNDTAIDGFGILMPMRADAGSRSYPDWMKVETLIERDARLAAPATAAKATPVAESAKPDKRKPAAQKATSSRAETRPA